MIKNIFFDFNGTILNDVKLCYDIEDEILKEAGLKRVNLDFYLNNFAFPVKNYYALLGFDFSKKPFEEINKIFMDRYVQREAKEASIYPDFIEVVNKFKRNGFKVYCLSASKQSILENQLKRLGIFNLFDGVVGCNNINGSSKVDVGKDYVTSHHINPKESIMIGDSEHDYEVSEAIGFNAALYSKGHCSKERLLKLNAPVFDDFKSFFNYVLKFNEN